MDRLTFVFTDIEGSTRLLEKLQGAYGVVLARHADIVRELAAEFGGREVDTQGDAFFIVFPDAAEGLGFTAELQRRLSGEDWPDAVELRLRIGVHTGQATLERTGYVGLDVHHGARVASAAHGGQVLVSNATAAEIGPGSAGDLALRSLGKFRLKDLREPLELLQLVGPGLATEFPPPRSLDERDEPPAPGDPPYPGLAQFEETDARRFFGRDGMVSSIADRLDRAPFLALIGASGSGKSSLLRAGLIPAIRQRREASDEAGAPLLVLATPTDQPLRSLERGLESVGGPPWLVAIDQFEELFTLCRDDDERRRFVDRLLGLLDDGCRVVITLRADFYDRVAQYARLRGLVSDHQEFLGPMSSEDLRRAIEGPATAGGWRFATGLVDLILHDIGREPGALPLLQHALRETWQRRRGTQLTLRGYLDSGSVQGAIARTADQTIAALQGTDLALARDIFLRLTELGEETPDTRRRASLDELVLEQRDPVAARSVLDRLIAARLVVTEGNDAEVAHEALIREWPTLRDWLESDRDSLRLHRRLANGARDWESAARDPSMVLRGARLGQALEWLANHEADASELERTFILTSKESADKDAAEREAQRQRELRAAQQLASAESARAEEQASAARRLRRRAVVLAGAVAVAAVLAIAAVVAGLQASGNAARADENAAIASRNEDVARARELASAAEAVIDRDPELSVLLASRAVAEVANPETDRQLREAVAASLVRSRFEGHQGPILSVAYVRDASRLVTASLDGSVRLWDVATRDEMLVVGPESGIPARAAVSADGSRIACVTDAGELWVWDTDNGAAAPKRTVHEGGATDVSFSPDGRRLLTAGMDGAARVWDVATQKIILELVEEPEGAIYSATYSPDGALIVTDGPGIVARVWDATSGELRFELVGHTAGIVDAAFSPDGTQIATAGGDETVRLWDLATGAPTAVLRGHESALSSIDYGPDGTLVTGGRDATAAAWDVATRERISVLLGHDGPVNAIAVSPDGETVTTGGNDGTLRAWALRASPPVVTLSGFLASVIDAAYSADGSRVVATSADVTARIFDAETGRELNVLRGHGDQVLTGAFSPDDSRILTSSFDGTARVWDASTGALILTFEGHQGGVLGAAFDPEARRIVTASDDGTFRIWNALTGAEQRTVTIDVEATAAIFSSDGTSIVGGDSAGVIGIWDAATGRRKASLIGHDGEIAHLALSPDGTRLASTSADGSIRVWDLEAGRTEHELRGDFGQAYRGRFSPDGRLIVGGGDDGAGHIWDAATGSLLTTIQSAAGDVFSAAFAPDGQHVLLGTRRSSATIHQCELCGSTEAVLLLAEARVTRGLSRQERAQFLHESDGTAANASEPAADPSSEATAPVDQPVAPVAADDVCGAEAGFCGVGPGTLNPSLFRPKITFMVADTVDALGSRGAIVLETPAGTITVLSGDRTFGYESESAIRIGTRAEDFIEYLRARPELTLSAERSVEVDGHSGVAASVATNEELGEPLDIWYADPFPFASVPDEQSRVVVVNVDDTYVVLQATTLDPATADELFNMFDVFVEGVGFPSS